MIIKVEEQNSGERIDKFLVDNLYNLSRSKIQKLIKNKNILVNNNEVSVSYILKEDDEVLIKDQKIIAKNDNEIFQEKLADDSKNKAINIIDDTKDYLVVNKPAGLIVHGAEHIEEPTLVDFLLKKYPKLKGIGEDATRPGIIHRLDKDASGLMVIAKNQKIFQNLKKQFQARKVYKEYTALVFGALTQDYGVIDFPIKRSTKGHKMAAIPKGREDIIAREAISEFEITKKLINYTLLKVKIKTGRTHQIRVHMAAYGHPIVGDDLYGTKRTRINNKKLNLGRIFLVASKLKFYDLDGEVKEYVIDLPDDLEEFLKKVK